ncbi:MAG: phosphate ABC transporter substrate-binding protein PstS [Deltaproteobacteria bacterium]|nr:phosphate ABC transporter substrate-binding protein PstS [Deltaproteobacteria bacterium]
MRSLGRLAFSAALLACCFATVSVAGCRERGPWKVEGLTSTLAQPLVGKLLASYHGRDPSAVIEAVPLGAHESARRRLTEKSAHFFITEGPVPLVGQPDLASRPVVVPVAVGGVAVVYHLAGDPPLRLTTEALVDLFAGKIASWDDPKLAAIDGNAKLPATKVDVVHRGDPSGTAAVFAELASEISVEWRERVGRGLTLKWPVGRDVEGTDGVVAAVKSSPGTIGLVPLNAAVAAGLHVAALQNPAGRFVVPDAASLTAAAAGATWPLHEPPPSLLRRPDPAAYPLAMFVYVVFDEARLAAPRVQGLAKFLSWALTTGQKDAQTLGYGTLPPSIVGAYGKGLEQLSRDDWSPPAL